MNRSAGLRPLLMLGAWAVLLLLAIQPALAEAKHGRTHTRSQPPSKQETAKPQETINAWTVGLAGGLLEGAPIRFAAEMARVVDDGDNLHVLPVVTRGPTENVNSLLYLRGID